MDPLLPTCELWEMCPEPHSGRFWKVPDLLLGLLLAESCPPMLGTHFLTFMLMSLSSVSETPYPVWASPMGSLSLVLTVSFTLVLPPLSLFTPTKSFEPESLLQALLLGRLAQRRCHTKYPAPYPSF